MKNYFLFLFSFLAFNIAAQTEVNSYTTKRGDTHLLGHIERSALQAEPYNEWFSMIYEKYKPDEKMLAKIDEQYSDNIKVKIFLGTWCGDSKREVSRFFKIADHSKINPSNVELICLDGRSETDKQGPAGEEKGLNIHRVPTFIFYENNKEIARIVESPANTLEKDIAQIYAGLAPKPNYRIANYAGKLFQENTLAEADTILTRNVRYLRRLTKGEGELNTMGYVLMAADEIEKAIVVFKLNTLLYPNSDNTFDSLGEAYMENGNRELAVENYLRSIELNVDNKNAFEKVRELVAGVENE